MPILPFINLELCGQTLFSNCAMNAHSPLSRNCHGGDRKLQLVSRTPSHIVSAAREHRISPVAVGSVRNFRALLRTKFANGLKSHENPRICQPDSEGKKSWSVVCQLQPGICTLPRAHLNSLMNVPNPRWPWSNIRVAI